jgi:hypothetical protein
MTMIMGNEVVEYGVGASYLEPGFFGIGGAADEVEHGVFLCWVLVVLCRGVNQYVAVLIQHVRLIDAILHFAVGHGVDGVECVGIGDFEQTGLEGFIGEDVGGTGIGYFHSVDDQVVGIDVGCG